MLREEVKKREKKTCSRNNVSKTYWNRKDTFTCLIVRDTPSRSQVTCWVSVKERRSLGQNPALWAALAESLWTETLERIWPYWFESLSHVEFYFFFPSVIFPYEALCGKLPVFIPYPEFSKREWDAWETINESLEPRKPRYQTHPASLGGRVKTGKCGFCSCWEVKFSKLLLSFTAIEQKQQLKVQKGNKGCCSLVGDGSSDSLRLQPRVCGSWRVFTKPSSSPGTRVGVRRQNTQAGVCSFYHCLVPDGVAKGDGIPEKPLRKRPDFAIPAALRGIYWTSMPSLCNWPVIYN